MKRIWADHQKLTAGIVVGMVTLVGFILIRSHAATPVDYTSGRVVHYDFAHITGTTVPDVSGNGNDGTLFNFGSPAPTEAGSDGHRTALQFDRSRQQRLGVGDVNHTSPATSLQVSKFTIASWIKITENDTTEDNWEIVEKGFSYWFNVLNGHANGTNQHYVLRCGGKFNGGTWLYLTGHVVIPHGIGNTTWAHVVCTYDGATMRIYVNGVQDVSQAFNLPLDRNDGAMVVGGNDKIQFAPNYYHNWWQGSLDDFRLYNRALSASDIAGLYADTGFRVVHGPIYSVEPENGTVSSPATIQSASDASGGQYIVF